MDNFEYIPCMKAQRSTEEFLQKLDSDPLWVAGEKFDGYREQLHLGETRNAMFSSLGNEHILNVPQFCNLIRGLAGTVVDCEGMSPTRRLEDNASCFKSQPYNAIEWQKKHGSAFVVAFDVLVYRGESLMNEPFKARRVALLEVVEAMKLALMPVRAEVLVAEGKFDYYRQIVARKQEEGHEGVMLKRLDGRYEPGRRSPAWLKVKRHEMVVATITGFTVGAGKYAGMIGSILFEAEGVRGAASGMGDEERQEMSANANWYIGRRAYFEGQSVTAYGALRHPQYKGLYDTADVAKT